MDNSPWRSGPLGQQVSTGGTGAVFAKKRTTGERGRRFESLASDRRTRAVEANMLSTAFIPEAAPGSWSPKGRRGEAFMWGGVAWGKSCSCPLWPAEQETGRGKAWAKDKTSKVTEMSQPSRAPRQACVFAGAAWPASNMGARSLRETFCLSEVAGELASQVEMNDDGSTAAATLAEGQRCP